jgi:hypothetical protein
MMIMTLVVMVMSVLMCQYKSHCILAAYKGVKNSGFKSVYNFQLEYFVVFVYITR